MSRAVNRDGQEDQMAQKLVWVDTETGGLDPERCQLIQVAAVATYFEPGFEELEQFEAKIQLVMKDGIPARAEQSALDMNCYNAEVWEREARPGDEVLASFGAFLRRHATLARTSKAGKPYTVAMIGGHNAPFDASFLRAWFKRNEAFLPAAAFDTQVFDSLKMAHVVALKREAQFESCRLATLCHEFGVQLPDAHDALADVLATVELARRMAASRLHRTIMDKELACWRRVFMFALALSDKQRQEVRALAYQRFMRNGMAIMYLLSPVGELPSSWAGTDEEELRAWLEEHFAPGEGGK